MKEIKGYHDSDSTEDTEIPTIEDLMEKILFLKGFSNNYKNLTEEVEKIKTNLLISLSEIDGQIKVLREEEKELDGLRSILLRCNHEGKLILKNKIKGIKEKYKKMCEDRANYMNGVDFLSKQLKVFRIPEEDIEKKVIKNKVKLKRVNRDFINFDNKVKNFKGSNQELKDKRNEYWNSLFMIMN